MNRRGFLLSAAATIGSSTVTIASPTIATSSIASLVLTGIDPGLSAESFITVLDEVCSRGIPVTCVVSPYGKDGEAISPKSAISSVLTAYMLQNKIEVAPFMPGLPNQSDYFQGRSLHEVTKLLSNALAGGMLDRPNFKTIASDDTENPWEPTGVRAGGVKTVLVVPTGEREVKSEIWPNGVLRLMGGKWFPLDLSKDADLKLSGTQSIFHLDMVHLEGMAAQDVVDKIGHTLDKLNLLEKTGATSLLRISDLHLRDNYRLHRFVAVHLAYPDTSDSDLMAHFETFKIDLERDGLQVSIGQPPKHSIGEKSLFWLPIGNPREERHSESRHLKLFSVNVDEISGHTKGEVDPGLVLQSGQCVGLAGHETKGLDSAGILWLPSVQVSDLNSLETLQERLENAEDVVVSIQAEALSNPYMRLGLRSQLKKAMRDGFSLLGAIDLLVNEIAPKGAEMAHQRRTVGALAYTGRASPSRAARERKRLFDDAQVAWSYISQNTIQRTGLCPATVSFSPTEGRVHPTVTMWDVGSHINGLIAASQIGFLPKREFERNIAKILRQVRGRKTQNRLLPQGWIRVDRQKWGNRNFDGSDAGRLLSSLENLRRYAGMNDQLESLVNSWDLAKIVIDGEVNSVTDGKLHSVYRSHSAHYSARAFRSWGVNAKSPYEVVSSKLSYDDQMRLLEAASAIGPLGAEPLLLEAMESDMSLESAYLAEVLFAAQVEDFKETGRLIAVSEGPIDRAPWFTYQGLQLDAQKRTWALDTVGLNPEHHTAEFWDEYLVLSSKAAFLWAAYKPHEHSDNLVEFVRRNCKTKQGFASSVFSKSGRVTSTYSDLNTNGVILQAIARRLGEA
ncbi:DUF3131 domain-containing protein [uncultured Sulfitobacter sp.]|uniref:DUF3131 domain-containing protein n=1 Tax=uncultured Sulfitobacter sp. TaxID=191468 RepID=UPI00261D566B|nr:DUF3131 domain-containing protein [uncultured Sulfitobacter sp.]